MMITWLLLAYGLTGPAPHHRDLDRHFDQVIASLRATEPPHLDAAQRVNRAQHIEALRRYRTRGLYPRNTYRPEPTPVFVDRDGTHCAVGWLLRSDGEAELVERIARDENLHRISQMHTPGLLNWQRASGLTLAELARIQPTYLGGWRAEVDDLMASGRLMRLPPRCGTHRLGGLVTKGRCHGDVIDWQVFLARFLLVRGRTVGGLREGSWIEQFEGHMSTYRFEKGRLHGLEEHHWGARLLRANTWQRGFRNGWSTDGKHQSTWRNGRLHGRAWAEGPIGHDLNFEDGRLHGQAVIRQPHSVLTGQYRDGRPVGLFRHYKVAPWMDERTRMAKPDNPPPWLGQLGIDPASPQAQALVRRVARSDATPSTVMTVRFDALGRPHGAQVWRLPTLDASRTLTWVAGRREGIETVRLDGAVIARCHWRNGRLQRSCALTHRDRILGQDLRPEAARRRQLDADPADGYGLIEFPPPRALDVFELNILIRGLWF